MIFLEGFITSLVLIAAIGVQNAFVIRQGILREYIFLVCVICAVSDSILILLGVFVFGIISVTNPEITVWLKIVGICWLSIYGVIKLNKARSGDYAEELGAIKAKIGIDTNIKSNMDADNLQSHTTKIQDNKNIAKKMYASTAYKTSLICLLITWGNPHVYLDTMVLLGTVSTNFVEHSKIYFAIGALSASWIFFPILGYGSKMISPLFHSATAWRYLDSATGLLMFAVAFSIW